MVNYESELNELFLNTLATVYQLEDRTKAYHYFILRFLIEYFDKEINQLNKINRVSSFLISELNLPNKEQGFIYNGEFIKLGFALENSIENIVVDWEFSSSIGNITNSQGVTFSYEEYIEKELKKLIQHGKNKAKPYKGNKRYMSYLKWNALDLLNKHYFANPIPPLKIEGVTYPVDHNFFIRTLEEIYSADIHSVELKTTSVSNITESDLEKFLIKNLDILEEGLQFVDNQYAINGARIDILARDKHLTDVIIELKVVEDKELLWQTMYYPMQYKKEKRVKNVRMITIAPEYSYHLLLPLKEVKGIEIVQFHPLIELGKIKSLTFSKIDSFHSLKKVSTF